MGKIKVTRIAWVGGLTAVVLLFQNCMSRHDGPLQKESELSSSERISLGAIDVLQNKCSSCHNPNSAEVTPLADILDFEGLAASDKKWLIPGEPQNSQIYTQIIDGTMPKDADPLSEREANLVKDWIIVLGGGDPCAVPGVVDRDISDPCYVPPGNSPGGGGGGVNPPDPNLNAGLVLYNQNCASCHGSGAGSTKKGRSAAQISGAIAGTQQMMIPLLQNLTPQQIQQIADYLATL
ncbi:MAG: c-type cytochrome [Bdellovibrionales bacterium]|nr:c-type cytochrome [Bdellovibrionales bacterium]